MLSHIDESTDPSGRINEKSPDLNPRPFNLSLKNIIKEPWWESEVIEKVTDADLNRIRHDKVIPCCHRLQHPAIDLPVEFEDLRIERFPRIVLIDPLFARVGKGLA